MDVKDLLAHPDFYSPLACGRVDIFIPAHMAAKNEKEIVCGEISLFSCNNFHVLVYMIRYGYLIIMMTLGNLKLSQLFENSSFSVVVLTPLKCLCQTNCFFFGNPIFKCDLAVT